MKTAVFSTKFYEKEYLVKFNTDSRHELVFFEAQLNAKTAKLAKGCEAVAVLVHDRIDMETAEKLHDSGIRAVLLRCAGYDNLDLEALSSFGIKALNVPAYSPEAIAEHAAALLLSLTRKTHKSYARTKNNNFALQGLMGFNLHGKTVAVIGTGRIGAAFCNIMLGFGCKVLGVDPYPSEMLKSKGVNYASFEEAVAVSDVVSVHCRLDPDTYHLFNKASFEKLKWGAVLINTARGAVLNTLDTISALKSGRLGALGIDVYEWEENLFFNDLSETVVKDDFLAMLLSYPNVLLTPHQGFFTKEAVSEICRTTIANLSDLEQGRPLANEIMT